MNNFGCTYRDLGLNSKAFAAYGEAVSIMVKTNN
jgi:hypothetical protein